MRLLNRAFSLIELMIVITIIGILAAVAVPAYQNYVIRSKITDALGRFQIVKTSVAEYYNVNGSMPTNANVSEINGLGSIGDGFLASMNISTISTATRTYVDIVFYNTGVIPFDNSVLASPVIGMSGDLDATSKTIVWTCQSGNIDQQYLPGSCKSI